MSLEIGQILDKYELVEEVGQGGMAVVYRGRDQSLRRDVAVKVLHRHLADNRESRERFEREAHAVAKLRHQNILEIFDFSGLESEESYIVTEFIDGQTLKQFVSDYDIRFPEVGAMIAVEVLRALSHAHGAGVLHRDIKPENIMVRNDGVVKLTDFGIAQMVDLHRMTVTGQLLGSPAYMSPEHVGGGQLDFRTDVFSVGILLYQLVTGILPFRGKNPHEILKRIAECTYTPAQVEQPLVGDQLGRIITKAMAREKDGRYGDVTQMLHALEAFLKDSGIGDTRSELARFFEAPGSYEMALEARLIDAWSRRGKELQDDRKAAALEFFNRVLTVDPSNEEVMSIIDRMSRRRRGLRVLALVAALVGIAGLAVAAKSRWEGTAAAIAVNGESDASPAAADAGTAPTPDDAAVQPVRSDAPPPKARDAGRSDANVAVRRDARVRRPTRPRADSGTRVAQARTFSLNVFPLNSEVRLNNGAWQPLDGRRGSIAVPAGDHMLTFRNTECCGIRTRRISAGQAAGTVNMKLEYLPATLNVRCQVPGVSVTLGGKVGRIGVNTIPFGDSLTAKRIDVTFIGAGRPITKTVRLTYKDNKVVRCD